MNIKCWFGIHDWFYYDEFKALDSSRRICKRCGLIQTTMMNTELGYGYNDWSGYASDEEKAKILNYEYQLERYKAELDRLIKEKQEWENLDKLFSDIPDTPSMTKTRHILVTAESSLMRNYRKKIKELSRITHEGGTEE